MNIRLFVFLNIIFLVSSRVSGQVIYPSDHTRDYYEILVLKNPEISHPISIHPSIISQYQVDSTLSWNIWGDNFKLGVKSSEKKSFVWVDPYVNYNANTITPRGYNDGAIWSGKGSNMALTGGFQGKLGILHFSFVPIVTWSQNLSIDIPPNVTGTVKSPYSYPFNGRIDYVQQFGEGDYSQFNFGQSEVRLVYKKMTLGVSTENFKWGPSIWNPILMSNNAAGIPHIDIGTAIPIDTKIGKVEGKWYWGAAYESDYFDDNPENDRKYVTGISLGYEPSFAPGLSLGLNRLLYTRWADGDLAARDIFAVFSHNTFKDSLKNDEYDQMISVSIKYRFPEVGFECYIEYAKNDFHSNLTGWFEEFDRGRALNWGVMKLFDLDDKNVLKFGYEFTTLSANQNQILPSNVNPPYYVHSVVPNGYTNQGQIMGAGIGTGSNGSILKIDWYNPKGKLGVIYSRIRFNDDYFVNAYSQQPEPPYPADFEVSAGIDYVRYFNRFSVRPQIMWNYRKNWYYQDDVEVHNFHFGLQIHYLIKNSSISN
ncbi:capsule assembly Wzi family protein [Reichenbachiella carrageenanivorans]|uniref:Capsule assembly Wzi family protein n=1 Tax=Reichenbachiella carrageenanivorans TaxID=2979869 RepID=A0ABY6CXQ7_9BACT|nr:capsule assembly Wzi family protein [Reichenbachiella carrageenanivorans]UXX78701.1 capsule assembly Wzi family protein [Reichenbachiella carrageenanivorans]